MDSNFWDRLRTFTILHWFSKPHTMSPVACARYGFTNTSRNEVTCVSCGIRITTAPNDYLPANSLHQRHRKDCKYRVGEFVDWRNAPEFSVAEYLRRLMTLNTRLSLIPAIPQSLVHSNTALAALTVNQLYACCGWEAQSESVLLCRLCNMTIILTAEEPDKHPLTSHRYYCPWITTDLEGVCGWTVTLSAISVK